ncbi:serine/arginine-rich splicing factor 7-like [Amphiura filiformis]|uniref:serine/arginine-rich splicing factor 7-like n=1 Tax=Amphiura filiformis TaxID=82378 RepID=UPI003B220F07
MSSRGYYKDSGPLECKVYVGDLGSGASRNDIEDAFREYGELKNVWVARNPPGFAFVEFEDARDAKEACDAMDGRRLCGRRIKVEMSSGETRRGGGRGGGYGRGPPPRRTDERCYECGESGHYARDCHNSRGHHLMTVEVVVIDEDHVPGAALVRIHQGDDTVAAGLAAVQDHQETRRDKPAVYIWTTSDWFVL